MKKIISLFAGGNSIIPAISIPIDGTGIFFIYTMNVNIKNMLIIHSVIF